MPGRPKNQPGTGVEVRKPGRATIPAHGYDGDGRPIFAYNDKGFPCCGAKNRHGQPCQSTLRMPNGRCTKHGGKTPSGPASANFKHGGYSQVMPETLKDTFRRMQDDPDLLSLRNEVALQGVRIHKLLEAYTGNDTNEENWAKLMHLVDDVVNIIGDIEGNGGLENPLEAYQRLRKWARDVSERIKTGTDQRKLWKEISNASLVKKELALAEQKREDKAKDYMPAETVMVIFDQIFKSIRRNVKSPIERAAIARDIDDMSALPRQRAALRGAPGAEGVLNPHSEHSDTLTSIEHETNEDRMVDLVHEGAIQPLERQSRELPKPMSSRQMEKLAEEQRLRGGLDFLDRLDNLEIVEGELVE